MGEKNQYRVIYVKVFKKRPFGRQRHRREDAIKVDLK